MTLEQLLHSIPPLPRCELLDPHDDITLPRLIEALEKRQRIRQLIVDECKQAGVWELLLLLFLCTPWFTCDRRVSLTSCLLICAPSSANTMRSSLKELDEGVFSRDDVIHKQNGKLAEKERLIQSQKADLDRLEKKTKMQEYKVPSRPDPTPGLPDTHSSPVCDVQLNAF